MPEQNPTPLPWTLIDRLGIFDDCEEAGGVHVAEIIEGEKGDCIAEFPWNTEEPSEPYAYARLFVDAAALQERLEAAEARAQAQSERADRVEARAEAAERLNGELVAALRGVLTRSILHSMLVTGDSRGYNGAKDAIDEREFDDGDVIALWARSNLAAISSPVSSLPVPRRNLTARCPTPQTARSASTRWPVALAATPRRCRVERQGAHGVHRPGHRAHEGRAGPAG